MREMLAPTSAIMGKAWAKTSRSSPTDVSAAAATALSSATSRRNPYVGGPIAVIIKNGDPITIDAEKRQITSTLPDKELAQRRMRGRNPPALSARWLVEIREVCSSASEGAVTDRWGL